MTDEDAFIRAIQASPGGVPTRLVYADWLEERGQTTRAAYLRRWVENGDKHRQRPPHDDAWCDLIHGRVALWDTPTMPGLGRLEGLLRAYSAVNMHRSDISCDFLAGLRRRRGPLAEHVAEHFPECYRPVSMTALGEWEGALRTALAEWLFHSLNGLPQGLIRLAFQDEGARGLLIDDVLRAVRDVIHPRAGWHLQISQVPYHFYALGWDDFVLEAEDRLHFLLFTFSD